MPFAAVIHSEARQAEGYAEHPRPQKEPCTESVINLEREGHPHDTANKQYY